MAIHRGNPEVPLGLEEIERNSWLQDAQREATRHAATLYVALKFRADPERRVEYEQAAVVPPRPGTIEKMQAEGWQIEVLVITPEAHRKRRGRVGRGREPRARRSVHGRA